MHGIGAAVAHAAGVDQFPIVQGNGGARRAGRNAACSARRPILIRLPAGGIIRAPMDTNTGGTGSMPGDCDHDLPGRSRCRGCGASVYWQGSPVSCRCLSCRRRDAATVPDVAVLAVPRQVCRDCPGLARAGRILCARCHAASDKARKARAGRLIASGACYVCAKRPPSPGLQKCATCRGRINGAAAGAAGVGLGVTDWRCRRCGRAGVLVDEDDAGLCAGCALRNRRRRPRRDRLAWVSLLHPPARPSSSGARAAVVAAIHAAGDEFVSGA